MLQENQGRRYNVEPSAAPKADRVVNALQKEVSEALSITQELCDRIDQIASRLGHSRPPAEVETQPKPVPNGCLHQLGNTVDDLRAALRDMDAAVGKIETEV